MSEQTKNLLGGSYNPDVLECLANLSNDEVFTPPKIVNQMLDMLPEETWSNPELKFLDPACKTGVFLREIAKRLLVGLQEKIPDLQERIDHVFQNQLYGIAITELTALASRRSLYCSKYANGKYSVSKFDNPDGNIRFVPINHTWENGKCKYCGASASQYQRTDDLETHAYEFIHTNNPEEIFGMKFDVVIGNPPYQLSTTEIEGKANAIPIYQKFATNSLKMKPRYFCMIMPARWMSSDIKELSSFRNAIIHDSGIRELHDFMDSKECFPGVDVKGGICYFLKDSHYLGKCNVYSHTANEIIKTERYLASGKDDIFIRSSILYSIKEKVMSNTKETVSDIASPQTPYKILTNAFKSNTSGNALAFSKEKANDDDIRVLGNGDKQKREYRFIPKNYPNYHKYHGLYKYKIFIPEAYGCGAIGEVPSTPVLGTPGDACTQTFIQLGAFETENEARNLLTYIRTKFFRAMVGIVKQTQHANRGVYRFVPLQDFSKPWTDEELYKKYDLSEEEIKFIEDNITPMEDK